MSTPLIAGPLPAWVAELARRRFRFAPAIVGAGPNEWTLHRVNLDDVIVVNVATQEELSIPRRWFGGLQDPEPAIGVVALHKKLEAHEGKVRPAYRNVIEMRPADGPRVRPERPATVIAIRETPEPVPAWKRYLRIVIAAACLLCFIAVYVFRDARSTARIKRFSTRPVPPASHPFAPELEVLPQKR